MNKSMFPSLTTFVNSMWVCMGLTIWEAQCTKLQQSVSRPEHTFPYNLDLLY
jgi:hypothetical protein